jgi:8-oxo-dGTP diphosphatase
MLDVACAIIIHEGCILAAQRSESMRMPGKWEFPGGKIEKKETASDCIKREILEELGLNIDIVFRIPDTIYHYPDLSIRLMPFVAKWISGDMKLHEHAAVKWLPIHELNSPDWAAADKEVVESFLSNIQMELPPVSLFYCS